MENGTGYRPDAERMDLLLATQTELPFAAGDIEMPTLFDPRTIIPIVNQGAMGSCVGNSGCYVLEWCNFLEGGEFRQMSRIYAYLMAQRESGFFGSDQGAAIIGMAKAAENEGICEESVFPYPSHYTTAIPASAGPAAAFHKLEKHTVPRSYDAAFTFLKGRLGGIQIGFNLVQSVDNNRNGLITALSGSSRGGHAQCWLEISPRVDSQGRNWLWGPNSWGINGWGIGGWAEWHPDVVDSICQRQTAIGFSKLKVLEPQQPDWGL